MDLSGHISWDMPTQINIQINMLSISSGLKTWGLSFRNFLVPNKHRCSDLCIKNTSRISTNQLAVRWRIGLFVVFQCNNTASFFHSIKSCSCVFWWKSVKWLTICCGHTLHTPLLTFPIFGPPTFGFWLQAAREVSKILKIAVEGVSNTNGI